MNWDCFSKWSNDQKNIIKEIIELELGKNKNKDEDNKLRANFKSLLTPNPHLSYHSLHLPRDFLEKDKKKFANEFRTIWQEENYRVDLSENLKKWSLHLFFKENFSRPSINITILPRYSFLLQVKFTLERPYISRDDQDFYIIDNAIRKDKVFVLPYVAPSSWKGSLRSALWQLGHKAEDDEICRLFGNERRIEELKQLRKGRLRFFPTFFLQKGLEIINPHDREKRVGKNPILLECVPEGASGTFTLLYIPFDLSGKTEREIEEQVLSDIHLVATGLKAMFLDNGFGAKTSSGYGTARSECSKGELKLKAKRIDITQKEQTNIREPEEAFKKYLNDDGSVIKRFKVDGKNDLLSNKQYKEKKEHLGGGSLTEFKKFRSWYGNHGKQWQEHIQSKNESESNWPKWNFKNFEELLEVAEKIKNLFLGEVL